MNVLEQAAADLVLAWAKYLIQNNRDPAAELKAMLDSADIAADAAENAKFGKAK